MFKNLCRIQKNEIFHVIIFAAVLLYFVALKLLGYISISWPEILLPVVVGAVTWLVIKLAKSAAARWRHNYLKKRK